MQPHDAANIKMNRHTVRRESILLLRASRDSHNRVALETRCEV
jgi:hypothetical protein